MYILKYIRAENLPSCIQETKFLGALKKFEPHCNVRKPQVDFEAQNIDFKRPKSIGTKFTAGMLAYLKGLSTN